MNKYFKYVIENYFNELSEQYTSVNINDIGNNQQLYNDIISNYFGQNLLSTCNSIVEQIITNKDNIITVDIKLNNKVIISNVDNESDVSEDITNDDHTEIIKSQNNLIRRMLPVIAEGIVEQISKNIKGLSRGPKDTKTPDFILDKKYNIDVKSLNNDKLTSDLSIKKSIFNEINRFNNLSVNSNDILYKFKNIITDQNFKYLNQILIIIQFIYDNGYKIKNVFVVPLICILQHQDLPSIKSTDSFKEYLEILFQIKDMKSDINKSATIIKDNATKQINQES